MYSFLKSILSYLGSRLPVFVKNRILLLNDASISTFFNTGKKSSTNEPETFLKK